MLATLLRRGTFEVTYWQKEVIGAEFGRQVVVLVASTCLLSVLTSFYAFYECSIYHQQGVPLLRYRGIQRTHQF